MGIHNSVLELALGRTILRNYANDWETLNHVLRLSRETTCIYVVTVLNLNDHIAGIMSNAKYHQIQELMRKFGAFGKSISGNYVPTNDVLLVSADRNIVIALTHYVIRIS
jgi:leucine dehydrogenase